MFIKTNNIYNSNHFAIILSILYKKIFKKEQYYVEMIWNKVD